MVVFIMNKIIMYPVVDTSENRFMRLLRKRLTRVCSIGRHVIRVVHILAYFMFICSLVVHINA